MVLILRAAIGAFFLFVGKVLALFVALRAAKARGAEQQAAKQTASALKAEAAIAGAEAQAPMTADEVAQRAQRGTF